MFVHDYDVRTCVRCSYMCTNIVHVDKHRTCVRMSYICMNIAHVYEHSTCVLTSYMCTNIIRVYKHVGCWSPPSSMVFIIHLQWAMVMRETADAWESLQKTRETCTNSVQRGEGPGCVLWSWKNPPRRCWWKIRETAWSTQGLGGYFCERYSAISWTPVSYT